jgi:hypothetical protein
MKNLFLLFVLATAVLSCKNETTKTDVVPEKTGVTMQDLSWVIGDWTNINAQTQSYEHWEKAADGSFVGESMTMRQTDTVFAERMKLYVENDAIQLYIVTVGDNPNPVVFTLKQDAEHPFTFENPRNEFPSQIVYTNPEANTIHAWVAGFIDEVPQKSDFYFKRAE